MTKTSLTAIVSFFVCFHSIGQVTDVPPNGKPNYRAVTGGSVKVNIDTISSLTTLINKLDSNWELVETDKLYWIGYTDDMYSIATYKDSAIEPLVKHFYSTKSENGKYGVIITLHLIGIESTIAGRFVEKFKNKNAREALLQLASDKGYAWVVLRLLGRDPWKTDLPVLLDLLRKDNNSAELVSALFRYTTTPYKENDIPFRQTIPQFLDTINVLMQDSLTDFQVGTLFKISELEATKIAKETSTTTGNNNPAIITQIGYGATISHWKFVINEREIQNINSYFKCSQKELIDHTCESIETSLDWFLSLSWEKISPISDLDYWNLFQYYFERNNLIICTVEQSAKRWLEYFSKRKIED